MEVAARQSLSTYVRRFERLGGGRYLGHDVTTLATFVEHSLYGLHLTCHTTQPLSHVDDHVSGSCMPHFLLFMWIPEQRSGPDSSRRDPANGTSTRPMLARMISS